MSIPPISITAYTDASLTGWGFHYGTVTKKGLWSPGPKNSHINVLELTTILLLVKHIKTPPQSPTFESCETIQLQ